jgi:Sortilin, neurotensin receptor 3,
MQGYVCCPSFPTPRLSLTKRVSQHPFKSHVVQFAYFPGTQTILVRTQDHSIWQSSSEGYHWNQVRPNTKFLAFYHHKYNNARAYLITDTKKVVYTTDTGRSWHDFNAPNPPNTFEARVLHFSPSDHDHIIWAGDAGCPGGSCHAESHFSRNNGRDWSLIEKYVRNCAFAQDAKLSADPTEIICESLKEKQGMQRLFGAQMQLAVGGNFYSRPKVVFESVVGFAKFSEFLVVAEVRWSLPHVRLDEILMMCMLSWIRRAKTSTCKFRWMASILHQDSSRRA